MDANKRLDLVCRFLLNLPASELDDTNRLMHHLDAAFWFFTDRTTSMVLTAENGDENKPVDVEWLAPPVLRALYRQLADRDERSVDADRYRFVWHLLGSADACNVWPSVPPSIAALRSIGQNDDHRFRSAVREAYVNYRFNYRYKIAVAGCAIVRRSAVDDQVQILLIRNADQPDEGGRFGIPKGKINRYESVRDCAARETYEETGFQPTIDDNARPICATNKATVFVVAIDNQVPIVFKPVCRGEVAEIRWFPLLSDPLRLTALTRRIWPRLVSEGLSMLTTPIIIT